MIFTAILGFVTGVFHPQVVPYLKAAFDRLGVAGITEDQWALAALSLALAGAALGLGLLGVTPYPVVLLLAAALGVLRKPVLARITSR